MSLSFLAPQFLWALLAIPIVIILHFIRARKKRQEVSALFLWKQAKEQAETRRRFSPSWLLALQLAFVTLAALALAQPSIVIAGRPDRILIVDTSASMAARDSDGVRLEKALREARILLRGAGRAALIQAGPDATVVQPLTETVPEVESALGTLVAVYERADIDRAISLALSLSPQAEIHLITDSHVPPNNRITIHNVAGDALNLGISAFELGLQQMFVSVVSNNPRPQEITLEIFQNGNPAAQRTLLVPANGQANTTFPMEGSEGLFEARISGLEADALELDNRAFVGQRILRVVSGSSDEALSKAFTSIPNVQYQVLPNAAPTAPNFDVRVIVGTLPDNARGNYLLFAPPSEAPTYQLIADWDRANPLLRFVDLKNSSVGLSAPVPFSSPDWQVLAQTSDLTPVILSHQQDGLNLVAFNVSPSQTDLVSRAAFPLLIANILTVFRSDEQLRFGSKLPEGAVRLEADRELRTDLVNAPGIYRIGNNLYTASLLSSEESRLPTPVTTEITTTPVNVERTARATPFSWWLVWVALLLLLAEWLLWSRTRRGWSLGWKLPAFKRR